MRKPPIEKLGRSMAKAIVTHVVLSVQGLESTAWVYRDGTSYEALVTSVRSGDTWVGIYLKASSYGRYGIDLKLEADVLGREAEVIACHHVNVDHASAWQDLANAEGLILDDLRRVQQHGL